MHSSLAHRAGLPWAAFRESRTSTRLTHFAVLATLVAASAWAVIILLTGTNASTNGLTVAYRVYAVAAPGLVGLLWWRRRPNSRIGTMLMLLAILAAVMAWQASAFPYRFSVGVLAEGPYAALFILLCLTFPTGRLEGPIAKALAGLLLATLLLTFVPWLVSGSEIYGSNPIFDCRPDCPANALQLTTLPESFREALATTCFMLVSVIGLAVIGLYVSRFRRASRPGRRAFGGLALTSLLVFPCAAIFVAGALAFGQADAERIGLTLSLAAAVIAFPIGFAVPLIAADLAAGTELQNMLGDLTTMPSRSSWRDRVAVVLDDPDVRIGYWDDSADTYVEPNGDVVSPASAGPDRLWIEIAQEGQPMAALATSAALATEPELIDAVATATIAGVTSRRLEGTRRDVSARAAGVVDSERTRIAREIETGPQQRLAALRVHIDLLGELEQTPPSHPFIEEFGWGVDKAMHELGDATLSRASASLNGHGVGDALRAARRYSPLTVRIQDEGLRRHAPLTEMAVYYCALEAIQNTVKHAGAGATLTIDLFETRDGIGFLFDDDGAGFDQRTVTFGSGLTNIRDRVGSLGGVVQITSSVGHGTTIRGSIPDGSSRS